MFRTPLFSRRRTRPSPKLSDSQLDALARTWTDQDRARLKAQRATAPRRSRSRIWQTIQDEPARWTATRPPHVAEVPLMSMSSFQIEPV